MRVFTLFVGVLAAGLGAVQAADMPSGAGRDVGLYYSASGQRSSQWCSGTSRAYWEQPWRNRHYFPTAGRKRRSGRHEKLHPRRVASVPAEPFSRGWTNAEARSDPDGRAIERFR
jgi:hypothetical protein